MKDMLETASGPVFVGNRLASTLDLVGPDGKTLRQKYIIGEPHACAVGTVEQMKRRGYVGAYSKKTEPVYYLPGSSRIIRKTW